MNTKNAALALIVMALSACGGGADYDHTMVSVLNASAQAKQEVGFNATTSTPGSDAQASVASQLRGSGDIALQIPAVKDGNYAPYLAHLQEAAKHTDRIKWLYLQDELFWSPKGGVQIGKYDAETTEAARAVQAYGITPAISMLPQVILNPQFKMSDINAFGVIAIDVYPSSITSDLGCAPVTDNPGSNLLYCSYQKLRAMGFKGEVWYIYQAFGNPTDPLLRQHLEQQRDTILRAPSIGIQGLVAFGLDMPATYEAPLYGLKGTDLEPLVTCSDWCTKPVQISKM